MDKRNFDYRIGDQESGLEKQAPIEISAQEIKGFSSIRQFVDDLSEQENIDFKDKEYDAADVKTQIKKLFQQKFDAAQSQLATLSGNDAISLKFKLQREAEYEAYKEVVDYKNEQFQKLLAFIENQGIWKSKFTTSRNSEFNIKENKFDKDSERVDEYSSFAGQPRDSIYFLSHNNVSLRLKRDNLLTHGISKVLQPPCELSIYIDPRVDRDIELEAEKEAGGKKEHQEAFKLEYISLEPKIGYRVYEYLSDELTAKTSGDFTSPIEKWSNDQLLVVKNIDKHHSGHQISKIEDLESK